jgi:hypothetical protein
MPDTPAATHAVPLQDWIDNHPIGSEMYWRSPAQAQLAFVRDELHHLLWAGTSFEDRRAHPPTVISSHVSKSILLPVYELLTPARVARESGGYFDHIGGLDARIRLRYNFFNWVVSVESHHHITDRFRDLFDREAATNPIYAEGFAERWVHAPFAQDRRNFTVTLGTRYDVWTLIWLLRAP